MFHFERGLFLTMPRLAIDLTRRQPFGFVSHAHHDHMAPHEVALCTPQTGRLYRLRQGPKRAVLELPYRQPVEWCGVRLTTFPAGHCLGSAMLLIEQAGQRLLYTGDFKLSPSATAEAAELPEADTLILETTYGNPRYRLPPRAETVGRLIDLVRRLLSLGRTPVIEAYTLGKAQEVTKLLTAAQIPVLQERGIHEVSEVYRACGVDLGAYYPLTGRERSGYAVIVPPRSHRGTLLLSQSHVTTIAVTGWANDPQSARRLRVDHAFPLSDHADYDELFAAVGQVGAKEVYCTHGPVEFADALCAAGFNARPLGVRHQMRLFS